MTQQKPQGNNKAKIRREKIINAARELFFKNGYKGTAIAAIAKLADYSKRSVYLDFKTKDDLFITICMEGLEILRQIFERIESDYLDYEDYLTNVISSFVDFSKEHREYFRMNYKEASPDILANCEPVIRQKVAELERACMEAPINFVKKGIEEKAIPPMEPYEAAMAFTAASSGVLLLAITGNQTLIQAKDVDKLVDVAIRSVKDGFRYQANEFYQNQS